MVQTFNVLPYGWDLLRRSDVIPWQNSGMLCESKHLGEECRGNLKSKSLAH
jgi:hypothetical protein